jgi:hypothetical protein
VASLSGLERLVCKNGEEFTSFHRIRQPRHA